MRAQRLSNEPIGWLTTAGADGQPQSSPVWFIWEGVSLWLRSQAHAGKVRNIRANPRVAFHLADDGHGGTGPGDPPARIVLVRKSRERPRDFLT
jgi:PPOX class probable F420-dependent enzyme